MSTKKIILIIAGIVAVLALIVALFVGAIAWFTFHTIGKSEAAEAARTFLRSNETLKQNSDGEATLYLKVYGERRTVNARVDLSYRNNRSWRVTGATYERDGNTIDLVQGYGPSPTVTPPSN
jgi:flagellar basal body-associated protein FliL